MLALPLTSSRGAVSWNASGLHLVCVVLIVIIVIIVIMIVIITFVAAVVYFVCVP